MTIKELKEIIKEECIPDTAEIYIFTDHGQEDERAYSYIISRSKLGDDVEEMVWEFESMEDYYDEDVLEEYDKDGTITAVLISSC
jgi:hypothetical protein